MLNKDQYNQDEYNDYYAKATQGAEIRPERNGEGGSKRIIFIILLLLLLGAGAYFIMQAFGGSDKQPSTPTKAETTVEAPTQVATAPEATPASSEASDKEAITQKIAAQIASQSTSDGANLDNAQMEQIVQAVLAQMNKANAQDGEEAIPIAAAPQDTRLMETLSAEETDLLATPDSISESETKKQASTTKTVDTYNKVVVESTTETNDLANQLSSLVDEPSDTEAENSNYTQSITEEVTARESEMRYWVVKRGDTLGKIAKEVYGNMKHFKKIYDANPDILRRPDRIYVGQKLRIPK